MPVAARVLLVTVLVGWVAGCRRSASARADEARAMLRSWTATVELLERERGRGAIPETFARQVQRAADEGRRQAEAQLGQASAE